MQMMKHKMLFAMLVVGVALGMMGVFLQPQLTHWSNQAMEMVQAKTTAVGQTQVQEQDPHVAPKAPEDGTKEVRKATMAKGVPPAVVIEQVKMFRVSAGSKDVLETQALMNEWLQTENPDIIRVTQSGGGTSFGYTIVTIFYKKYVEK